MFLCFVFLFCLPNLGTAEGLRVGDPGVVVDESMFDPDYPQMERWGNAGVRGGIPFISSFDKTVSIQPGSSVDINAAITQMASSLNTGQKGLITLKNGIYSITSSIVMKSNVSIIGESRDGVRCIIDMSGNNGFYFNDVKYCGLYRLTMDGIWGRPKYDWNYSLNANREFSNDNCSVRLRGTTSDCWLDQVTILNAARDPLRCPADHNTFRDLVVDGCKRKAGGAEGYFFIQGGDNLITGCQITHIRHISLQGGGVEYNVVYNNDFQQEVSFHSSDDGNNLIENNRITLPVDMPPVNPADGDSAPYPECENNKPNYFAIMGPWSIQHDISSHPNYLYRNKCLQLNHKYGTQTPWSDDDVVYAGPIKIGKSTTDHINNFPIDDRGTPSSETLYPVNLGLQEYIKATSITVYPNLVRLTVADSLQLTPTITPYHAVNKKVTWISSDTTIASVDSAGLVVVLKEGKVEIIVSSQEAKSSARSVIYVGETVKETSLLPGKIEAESWSRMSGVQTENTSDINGGLNVGYIEASDWLEYEVDVAKSANYFVDFRVASKTSDVSFDLKTNGTVLTSVNENATGDFQKWETIRKELYLDKGTQVLRIEATGGGWNFNWMAFSYNFEMEDIEYVETFRNLKLAGWGTETYSGDNNLNWTVNAKGVSGYIDDSKGIYFHSNKIGVESEPIQGGIASFAVKCKDLWDANSERKIELLVNNEVVGSKTHTGSAVYSFAVNNINVDGEFTLAIKNASDAETNNTLAIDDISWTTYVVPADTAGMSDFEILENEPRIYPNPFSDILQVENVDKLCFYTVTGEKLCSYNVENSDQLSIDYTTVPKGFYILKLNYNDKFQTLRITRF